MRKVCLSLFLTSGFSVGADVFQCPPNHYKVSAHPRTAYIRSNGVMVKASKVSQYCKEFSAGYSYANPLFKKPKLSEWPNKQEQPKNWTEHEKKRVIDALDNIPEIFLTKKLKSFYRFSKSKDYPNPASAMEGVIAIYDSAFDSSRNLERIIAHELAHQIYYSMGETRRQDYRRATNWEFEIETDGKIYWLGRKEGYTNSDGKRSPEEDYANNLEYFLYEPAKLKEITPNAYEWMRKAFGDELKVKDKKK